MDEKQQVAIMHKNLDRYNIQRYRAELQHQIEAAERMLQEAPDFIIAKFSKQELDEHNGYISGLKTAQQIIDHILNSNE